MIKPKKQTGAFRAGIITALTLLVMSFVFNAISFGVTVALINLGISAVYIGVVVNILGAAFSAWVGARIAMAGREMKINRSTAAATTAAIIPSLFSFASGIAGGIFASISGHGGSYAATIIQVVVSFIVIFVISKAVFFKREVKAVKEADSQVAENSDNG